MGCGGVVQTGSDPVLARNVKMGAQTKLETIVQLCALCNFKC